MATPKKSNPQRAGRKQKVNAEIAKKLETAAAWSYSKLQMALYAWISDVTLYAHFKRFPEFAKRIEALRNTPTMNSKRIFCEAIEDGDVKAAEYWLSRHETARDEYATKSITEGTSVVSVSTDLTDAARKALAMMDA